MMCMVMFSVLFQIQILFPMTPMTSSSAQHPDERLRRLEEELRHLKKDVNTQFAAINNNADRMKLSITKDLKQYMLSPQLRAPQTTDFADAYTEGLTLCFAPFYNQSGGHWARDDGRRLPGKVRDKLGSRSVDYLFANPRRCHIPMEGHSDISFNISGLVSVGWKHHTLFLIHSLNAWDYGHQYVLKGGIDHQEFAVMRHLSSFEHIQRNTILVYPDKYPLFEWSVNQNVSETAMIMEYVEDARWVLYGAHIREAFDDLDEVIPFLLKCYNDIHSVLDRLWEFEGAFMTHNDLHFQNIIVSADDHEHECKLIDFGKLFSFKAGHNKTGKTSGGYNVEGSHSPFAARNLQRQTARNRLIESLMATHGLSESMWRKYREYGYAAQQYKVQWAVLRTAMAFVDGEGAADIDWHIDKGWGSAQCEWGYIYHLECLWCVQQKQTSLLIRILKKRKKDGGNADIEALIQFAFKFLRKLEGELEDLDNPMGRCRFVEDNSCSVQVFVFSLASSILILASKQVTAKTLTKKSQKLLVAMKAS